MFGNMFNDIVIRRFDTHKNEVQSIKVPIQYSPKMHWLAKLERPQADQSTAVTLPRLGFEITSLIYDSSRKVNPIHTNKKVTPDKNKMYRQFFPVPYKLGIELFALTKNADDGFQIAEQILPFFTPDFTTTMKLIPPLEKVYDIKTTLINSTPQDAYEGDYVTRRAFIWTFGFELDVWYFGPVQRQGVIKRVQVDMHIVPGEGPVTNEEIEIFDGVSSRIVVKPGLTPDGKPTTNPDESIHWSQINVEDDYGFITEVYEFHDGRRYNPVTGEDVI